MTRLPPVSKRTDTPFPHPTLLRSLTRSEWRRCYPCRNPQRIRSRNGDQAYREADSGEDREDGEEEGRAEEGGGREIDGEEGRLRGGGTQDAREEEGRSKEDRGEEGRSEEGRNEAEGDREEVRRPQGDEQGSNADRKSTRLNSSH